MIATTFPASQTSLAAAPAEFPPADWQRAAAESVTDPAELLRMLNLDLSLLPAARQAAAGFPLRVPRGFVARMRQGDPNDPLLRQVLPLGDELTANADFTEDPVGDLASSTLPGVLHKYDGRALFIATGACAVHCRYCFRRHFPYETETASSHHWAPALEYVRSDPTINEVILSGGDPLNLSDRRLDELTQGLARIEHVRRLRLHTRTAVVLPERVDAAFCRWLTDVSLQKVVVLHCNHAQEIDAHVIAMCERLRRCGVTLLNQAVLLTGVNDDVVVLSQLSECLFAAGVLPYYLSLLDRVQGAAHFEVGERQGVELMRALADRLPGYLVPKLVREIAGRGGKTSVSLSP